MKEVRTRLTPELLAVVEALRAGRPRTYFLADAIRMGVRAIHAEASRNAPPPVTDGGLGLAALKVEGEYAYYDRDSIERIGALIDRLSR